MRAALLLSILLLAGCAQPADPWDGRDRDAQDPRWESYILQTGYVVEFDVGRLPGQSFGWDWFTEEGAAVTFDVHHHSPDVIYAVGPLEASSHAGTLTADRDTVYSLQWENAGAPVTLWLRAPIQS